MNSRPPIGRTGHPDTFVTVNGYAIREIRKLVGITTARFATETNLERSYISHIENGRRTRVNPAAFAAMVAALGVDRRALLAQPAQQKASAA